MRISLAAAAGATALLAVAGCTTATSAGPPEVTSSAQQNRPQSQRMTETATDGGMNFRVTNTDTASHVKGDGGTAQAQGQYLEVWLAVTNHGSRPRYVQEDEQQLHAGGKSYSIDTDATIDVDQGPEIGLPEMISPGVTEMIILVYDVPHGTSPTALEVHGSDTSDGALVALPGSR